MLNPLGVGPGGLIVVVLKDRPERGSPAVRLSVHVCSQTYPARPPHSDRAFAQDQQRSATALGRASLAPERSVSHRGGWRRDAVADNVKICPT